MLETLDEIKAEINAYEIEDILQACYNYFDLKTSKPKALWVPLTIMKWTYLYGTRVKPVKPLTDRAFQNLFDAVLDFQPDHISQYLRNGNISKAFTIIHYQQFYLQTVIHTERFATQLKLYSTLISKYDIQQSFEHLFKLSIKEFISIMQLMWLYSSMKPSEYPKTKIEGYVSQPFLDILYDLFGKIKTDRFFLQLMITPNTAAKEAIKWNGIRKEEHQNMERSFLTLFPFQFFNNQIRIVDHSILKYSLNYYIYDIMKLKDPKFTTEFGARFEKYIQLGLEEMKVAYKPENKIRTMLPKGSKLVDFVVDDNIFIECKAIEPKALSSINPQDDYIYSTFKDSLLKAYYDQMLSVTKKLNSNNENWGIIITHKIVFWSDFRDLYNFTKSYYCNSDDNFQLPPENVFIMDIYTWDLVVNVISTRQTTLLNLITKARNSNANPQTRKAQFEMHLDDFNLRQFQLSYLIEELKMLKI